MNKSPYIDPKNCKSCGLCCKSFQIGYSKERDKALLSEVERFKLLNTDLIQVHEDATGFWVEFKIDCKHLKTNEEGYYCEIYDKNRPELCERYPHKDVIDCPHKINKK